MRWGFGPRIRHPLFADLAATSASSAKGTCIALYGRYAELTQAAVLGIRVTRAIFVLLDESDSPLGEAERRHLWYAFGVPVFGLMVDAAGRVLAYECEAYAGLHIARTVDAPSDWYLPDSAPCECGRPGHRIVPHPVV